MCTVARWEPICNSYASDNAFNESIVAGGTWELRTGYRAFTSLHNSVVYSGGGKVPGSAEAGMVTFACRDVGAVAKCIERDGYKPWVNSTSDRLHQACVRMTRADYCGDGRPWTSDGKLLNVWDGSGIQSEALDSSSPYYSYVWYPEATWDENGAICTSGNFRLVASDPSTDLATQMSLGTACGLSVIDSQSSISCFSSYYFTYYYGTYKRTALLMNDNHVYPGDFPVTKP